jgi:heme exporter protein D
MKRVVLTLAVLALSGSSQAADMDWPEAVKELERARNLAEECVKHVKEHDRRKPILRTRRAYGFARVEYNAVIEGLIAALFTQGGTPKALPTIESDLKDGNERVVTLCRIADYRYPVPGYAGTGWIAVTLEALPAVRDIIDAYYKYRERVREDAARQQIREDATRQQMREQLQTAKWRDFDDILAKP